MLAAPLLGNGHGQFRTVHSVFFLRSSSTSCSASLRSGGWSFLAVQRAVEPTRSAVAHYMRLRTGRLNAKSSTDPPQTRLSTTPVNHPQRGPTWRLPDRVHELKCRRDPAGSTNCATRLTHRERRDDRMQRSHSCGRRTILSWDAQGAPGHRFAYLRRASCSMAAGMRVWGSRTWTRRGIVTCAVRLDRRPTAALQDGAGWSPPAASGAGGGGVSYRRRGPRAVCARRPRVGRRIRTRRRGSRRGGLGTRLAAARAARRWPPTCVR